MQSLGAVEAVLRRNGTIIAACKRGEQDDSERGRLETGKKAYKLCSDNSGKKQGDDRVLVLDVVIKERVNFRNRSSSIKAYLIYII